MRRFLALLCSVLALALSPTVVVSPIQRGHVVAAACRVPVEASLFRACRP